MSISEQIQELAELQFSVDEVEIIAGIEIEGIEEHEKAFLKGRLLAQSKVRKQILLLASQGSTPAAKQFLELVEASEAYES